MWWCIVFTCNNIGRMCGNIESIWMLTLDQCMQLYWENIHSSIGKCIAIWRRICVMYYWPNIYAEQLSYFACDDKSVYDFNRSQYHLVIFCCNTTIINTVFTTKYYQNTTLNSCLFIYLTTLLCLNNITFILLLLLHIFS